MNDDGKGYWRWPVRRAMSRRRLMANGALTVASVALSAACRSGPNPAKGGGSIGSKGSGGSGGSDAEAAPIFGKEWPTSAGTPKYGGSLLFASNAPAMANLDPILSASSMVHYVVSNAYSKLMRVSRKPDDMNAQVIYPDLATSWEIATPTTWTFHLRAGVRFHDVPPTNGRNLTAEDVKYSLLRSATDKSSQLRGGYINLDSIETPDKQTVVLKLKSFDSLLFNNLAGHYGWVVSHELADGPGLKNNIVGSGPFIFQSWEQDSVVNFKKNPNYYLKGTPFVDELKMPQIQSQDDRVAALRSGQVVEQAQVSPIIQSRLQNEVRDLQFQKYAVVNAYCLFMNYKDSVFQDERVRKAISLSMSRDAVIKLHSGGDGLWRGVISNQNAGWTLKQDELKSKDYYLRQDVAEAKQLMAPGMRVASRRSCSTTRAIRITTKMKCSTCSRHSRRSA